MSITKQLSDELTITLKIPLLCHGLELKEVRIEPIEDDEELVSLNSGLIIIIIQAEAVYYKPDKSK
jgi:hypothetical protein